MDIIDNLRHQKQVLTTSDIRYVEGTFVVKLHAQIVDSHFFNTQLPLNEDGNDLNKQLLTTTEVNVVVVTSVVNLCDLKAKIYVFKITSE